MAPLDVLAPLASPPVTAGRLSAADEPDAAPTGEGAFCDAMERALAPGEPAGPSDAGDADSAQRPAGHVLDPSTASTPLEQAEIVDPVVEVVPELPSEVDIDDDADAATTELVPPRTPTLGGAAATIAAPTAATVTSSSTAPDASQLAATVGGGGTESVSPPAAGTHAAPILGTPAGEPMGGDGPASAPPPPNGDAPAATADRPHRPSSASIEQPTAGVAPTKHEPESPAGANAEPATALPVAAAESSAGTDPSTTPVTATGATPAPRGDGHVAPAARPPVPDLTSPRTSEPPPAWRQVADALVGRAGADTSPVTIELHPAELGSVRAEISMRDGALRVDLRAATGDAKAMLEHAVGELRHDLHRLGMRLGHIEVHDTDGAARPGSDASGSQGGATSGRSDTDSDRRDGSLARPRPAVLQPIETRPTTTATDADRLRPRPGRPTTQVDLNL
jgi:chemotaxis protein MotD